MAVPESIFLHTIGHEWSITISPDAVPELNFVCNGVGIAVQVDERKCTVAISSQTDVGAVSSVYGNLICGYLAYVDNFAPIHGSCVSRSGSALCIAGAAGVGKSTVAAALVARGAKFVSDGVTIVDPETALVRPGPATRRLWDDALRWLGEDPEKHPSLRQGPPKRICQVPEDDLVQEPVKLRAILVVEDSDSLAIERLGPQWSVIELIRHGFLSPWLDAKEAPKLTRLSAAVARLVPVYRLRRPKQLDAIPELVDMIQAHWQ